MTPRGRAGKPPEPYGPEAPVLDGRPAQPPAYPRGSASPTPPGARTPDDHRRSET
ncbi:hypothetical protein GCM10010335_27170 [Streptomyces galbus]|nr:hypothetical protein GCM10010335_27170 [Streptomyces galbus]